MRKETFQSLLEAQKNRVFSYAWYFLRSREDAEDVTQEVFLRLWQKCEEMETGQMKAWLMRVAHNLCVDVSRRRKNRPERPAAAMDMVLETVPEAPEAAADPERRYQVNETQQKLLEALEGLPERMQSIFLMLYYQGLTYEETAEILEMNINTVKVTVFRGKRMLKELLAGRFPERAARPLNMCLNQEVHS